MRHEHYFRYIGGVKVDLYYMLTVFSITDPAIAHAIKKLMFAGIRGVKSQGQDVQEAIDTLVRWQHIQTDLVDVVEVSECPNWEAVMRNPASEQTDLQAHAPDWSALEDDEATSGLSEEDVQQILADNAELLADAAKADAMFAQLELDLGGKS